MRRSPPGAEGRAQPLGSHRTRPLRPASAGHEHRSPILSAAPLAESAVAAVGTSPTPTATFAALGAPASVVANLADRGITEAFPIQTATLPDALAGRDVCGKAPTGSGKTIAFGIPLVSGLGRAEPRRPRGLVLVPTRELATQVHEELRALAGRGGATSATFFGGVGFGPQLAALRRGVDIAVACPGRLADLVQQGEIHLDQVRLVVIDEADRMADMGFLPEVKRLLDRTPDDRQTLLFSATLDGDVDVLIRRYQSDPARHELVGTDDEPTNRHLFWNVDRSDRLATTVKVVESQWPAVVFVRTKRGADRIARQLERDGVAAAAIHGDRSQAQRERALAAFSSGRVQALVATDVAARGIHVDGVASVVHFDVPADHKDFVHRSGRTGRAGSEGLVVTFVPSDQVKDVKRIQRTVGLPVGIHPVDLDALGPLRPVPPPAPREREPRADRPGGGKPRRPRQGGPRGGHRNGAPRRNGQGSRGQGGGGQGGGQRTDGPRNEGGGAPRNGKPRTGGRPTAKVGGRPGGGGKGRRGAPAGGRGRSGGSRQR